MIIIEEQKTYTIRVRECYPTTANIQCVLACIDESVNNLSNWFVPIFGYYHDAVYLDVALAAAVVLSQVPG